MSNGNNLKYMHFRRPAIYLLPAGCCLGPIAATGGVTVAYREFENNGVRYLKLGFARCNAEDHYENAVGRSIARSRYCAEQTHTLVESSGLRQTVLNVILRSRDLRKSLSPQVYRRGDVLETFMSESRGEWLER